MVQTSQRVRVSDAKTRYDLSAFLIQGTAQAVFVNRMQRNGELKIDTFVDIADAWDVIAVLPGIEIEPGTFGDSRHVSR